MTAKGDDKHPPIERSPVWVLYSMLTGVAQGLQIAAQTNAQPTDSTIELLRALEVKVLQIAAGEVFSCITSLPDKPSLGDMLVKSEMLRYSLQAFFTGEELEERKTTYGFNR